MKIAFHSNQLGFGGTEVAMYDYAHYNETLLGNQSYIVSDKNASSLATLEKFQKRFPTFLYDNFGQVEQFTKDNGIEAIYLIKSGQNDSQLVRGVKNLVHAVFGYYGYDPHGDIYAYVSSWLARTASNNQSPYVPHIIHPMMDNQQNYRAFLKIPDDVLVLGYMPTGNFNIPFARECVYDIAKTRPDVYFLFMGGDSFITGVPNVIHLAGTVDSNVKVGFINTCDVCFHARDRGETFGLTVGEFSVHNKPVLTYMNSSEQAHLDILGDRAIRYKNKEQLLNIILNIKKEDFIGKDWNAYREYTPEVVMKRFNDVFLR